MSILYLVRHAHAGQRGGWNGPDDLRPLSRRGRGQADELARQLGDAGIRRLVSSPSLRCVQTLAPLAKHLGLRIEEDLRVYEGARVDGALRLIRRLAGRPSAAPAAVCSHGDIVGGIVDQLIAAGVAVEGGRAWAKGSAWRLDITGGTVTAARYLPPPA